MSDKVALPNDGPAPVILVSYSINAERATAETRAILNEFADSAITSLQAEGARVVVLDASREARDATVLVSEASGVVILGGEDIDPNIYDGPQQSQENPGIDRRADEFELALARAAFDLSRPVLGICRGMQLINVARGGNLIPELGPATMHSLGAKEVGTKDHEVRLLPESAVKAIYHDEVITIRSGHHQAVGVVGDGLSVTAESTDGVIEAIEAKTPWTVGVQWHPEDPRGNVLNLRSLAHAFVAECNYTFVTRPDYLFATQCN